MAFYPSYFRKLQSDPLSLLETDTLSPHICEEMKLYRIFFNKKNDISPLIFQKVRG